MLLFDCCNTVGIDVDVHGVNSGMCVVLQRDNNCLPCAGRFSSPTKSLHKSSREHLPGQGRMLATSHLVSDRRHYIGQCSEETST